MRGGLTTDDPRPIAKKAPYTFHLPNDAEIAAVGVGDQGKLVFRYHGQIQARAVERIWVTVSAVAGVTLTDALDNDPSERNPPR